MADDENSSPTLTEVLQRVIEVAREGIDVALPGIVTSFDPDNQRVDVQIAIRRAREGENGARVLTTRAGLGDVPVMYQGSGGYYESFPITKGTTGLIHFCGASIARYKTSGGVVDPGDDRKHHSADCYFAPAGRPSPNKIKPFASGAWVIAVPSDGQLRLGGPSASQSAVLGDVLSTSMDTMLDAMSAAWSALVAIPTVAALVVAEGAPTIAAVGAFTTAITAFKNTWAARLSAHVKLDS